VENFGVQGGQIRKRKENFARTDGAHPKRENSTKTGEENRGEKGQKKVRRQLKGKMPTGEQKKPIGARGEETDRNCSGRKMIGAFLRIKKHCFKRSKLPEAEWGWNFRQVL